jgi:broad specificity phosphatase PhoE
MQSSQHHGDPARRGPRLVREMTRLFLIRHADVENPGGVFYGHLESFRLSSRGRAQAIALGRALRGSGIRRIVHSPLERTRETAELIAGELEPPPALAPHAGLVEAWFGHYLQGVPYWQVPLRRPLWFVHRFRRGLLPGDETVAAMGARVVAVAKQLAAEHPDEVSACVSHGDPLQAAWVLLEGRTPTARELGRKRVARAGMLRVELEGGRATSVAYLPPP